MDQHQLVVQLEWDTVARLLDILESIKKNLVSLLVVSNLLLLLGDVHRNLYSLLGVTNGTVKFEGVLRLLRDVISFSHEVVD